MRGCGRRRRDYIVSLCHCRSVFHYLSFDALALHSLQGVLGKTSGRSYKAAPRQLLQVDPSTTPAHAHISKDDAVNKTGDGAIKEAAKLGKEALGNVSLGSSFPT